MRDSIIELGQYGFGVLTAPPTPRADDLCVVLLNAGFIHRSGPFRLHVRAARELAARGFSSFRYDAPGIGDTLQRSALPILSATLATLDELQARTGCRRFIVGGICSGADLGWQLAVADPRVVGLLLIDGILRKGGWYRFGRLLRAARKSPRDWLAAIRLRVQRRTVGDGPGSIAIADQDLRDWPAIGTERGQLATLNARNVATCFIYTGGASYVVHARQFGETFGAGAGAPNIDFHFWPDCDHTFFAESDRRRLIAAIGAWVSARFDQHRT